MTAPRSASIGAQPVAILDGLRTPFARQFGHYAECSVADLGAACVAPLVSRSGLERATLGELAFGAVIRHARDWNLAREVVLRSGLSAQTPGLTLQRACGTGLDAAITVANKIALGQAAAGIAGGADSTSEVPLVLDARLNRRLLALARAKGIGGKLSALLSGFRFGELKPESPAVREARTGRSMGEHCEDMAKAWRIGREAQDRLALASHQRAAAAHDRGFFASQLAPAFGLARDALLRPDTSLDKLATLKPAFDRKSGYGTLTAGNSSALSDGAAAVLLGSESFARERGLAPLAWLVDSRVAAVDFEAGEGLLMAPVMAIAELLDAHRLSLADIDIFEIHEAFAAQVLCTLAALADADWCAKRLNREPLGAIDPARLNPVGSSLALGHPFAATGARLLMTVARQLAERGGGRALLSLCTAGGMGVVALLEA